MNNAFNTCRLCKKAPVNSGESVFQYGARHYVHTSCGIERWGIDGFFGKISAHTVEQLPAVVLDKYPGAIEEAQRILERLKAAQAAQAARRATE